MRPQLSDETLDEIQRRIRSDVRVPPDRLAVEQQLAVLIDLYDERGEELQRVRAKTNF